MRYSIKKDFRFEAAHRLVNGYEGKCSHIHGHSWLARVTLASENLNSVGMVLDFAETKKLGTWINDHLDHAMLVAQEDVEMLQFLSQSNQRHFVFMGNPTSERLAELVFSKAVEFCYPVVAVEIQETCTASARFERSEFNTDS